MGKTPTKKTHNKQATAFHEAGHAVVAWLEGIRIEEVSIIPSEDSHGHVVHFIPRILRTTRLDVEVTPLAHHNLLREIRVLLAGEIAQRRFAPRSLRHYHGDSDRRGVADYLSYITSSDREFEAYFKLLVIQTEDKLFNHDSHVWSLIERVAQALMVRGQLSWKELLEITR